jgi:hypothetical protein
MSVFDTECSAVPVTVIHPNLDGDFLHTDYPLPIRINHKIFLSVILIVAPCILKSILFNHQQMHCFRIYIRMPDCWLEVSISIGCFVVSCLVCTVVVVLSVLLLVVLCVLW